LRYHDEVKLFAVIVPPEGGADIHTEDIPFFENLLFVGDAMNYLFIDGGANGGRENFYNL